MGDDIKNVFISHVHEDDGGLADLKELIGKGGLTVRDSSINSSNPNDAKDSDYIKSQILRVIALIDDPAVIRRILEHLGLWAPQAMQ